MRLVVVTVVALVVSLLVTASVMPIVIAKVPAAREAAIGTGVMAAIGVVTFVFVWLVWPRPKS